MNTADKIFEFGLGYGKLFAFLYGFLMTGIMGGLLFMVAASPIVLFFTWSLGETLAGSAGTAIGCGLVSGFFYALQAKRNNHA